MNIDSEISKERKRLKLDKLEIEESLKSVRNRYANLLLGDMGKDIDNVTSGKVFVRFSTWEKIKYSIKTFFNKILRIV
jgi:hypothetical protein